MKKPSGPTKLSRPNTGPVGYGRPPVHSRFKPGLSGNPTGRPGARRLTKNSDPREIFGTLLWKIAREKLTVREGERTLTVTKLEAMIRNLAAKAMKADVRAATKLFELLKEYRAFDPAFDHTTSIRVRFIEPKPG